MGWSLLVGMLLLGSFSPVSAADWPQFRGPNCTGLATQAKNLPVEFSPEKNLRWSLPVGDGIGSPVAAAGRVFISGMTGEQTVTLFAVEAKTGKLLWKRDWETGKLAEIHKSNSQASTTAAADDQRVYFYFQTLGLITVDAATGKDIWHQKLPTPFFAFKWGPGMSPVLYKDMVIFCQDDDLYPAVYAFDRATGDMRWKDERFDMACNYSHPIVCTVNGQDEIVVAGTGLLIGYDPHTGKRKWFAKVLLRNIKTTPVCLDGTIYISLQSGGIANQWLASVDRVATGNNDNKLDKAEMQAFVGEVPIPEAFFRKTFDRGDLNKDGFLEGEELDIAFLHPDNFAGAKFTRQGDAAADEFILAVRGGGQGDVTNTHVLWKHPTKQTDHVVSPVVSQGRMLLIKCGGITTVFQAKDGSPLRTAKRVGSGSDYFASPVIGDGKIYCAGENGQVIVLEDSADYPLLARNDLGESILATPAIVEDTLLVRTRTKLMCFGK